MSKGNSHCRHKSSARRPQFKISSNSIFLCRKLPRQGIRSTADAHYWRAYSDSAHSGYVVENRVGFLYQRLWHASLHLSKSLACTILGTENQSKFQEKTRSIQRQSSFTFQFFSKWHSMLFLDLNIPSESTETQFWCWYNLYLQVYIYIIHLQYLSCCECSHFLFNLFSSLVCKHLTLRQTNTRQW